MELQDCGHHCLFIIQKPLKVYILVNIHAYLHDILAC